MTHHHKSNKAVEGDWEHGHNRGMPRRPDEDELAQLTVHERREAGLTGEPAQGAEAPTAGRDARARELAERGAVGRPPPGHGGRAADAPSLQLVGVARPDGEG